MYCRIVNAHCSLQGVFYLSCNTLEKGELISKNILLANSLTFCYSCVYGEGDLRFVKYF
jgi:hypothetical protein